MATINTSDNNSYIGRKFQRVGKPVFVTVEDYNDKTRTVLITFPDGKTMNLAISTLKDKRLWEPYEGDMPEAEEPEMERYIPGTPEDEPTILRKPIKKDHKPLGRPKKPESEKKKPAKKEPKPDMCPTEFIDLVTKLAKDKGCTIAHSENTPKFYGVIYGKTCILRIYKGKRDLTLNMKTSVAEELPYESHNIKGHMLSGVIKCQYTDNYKKVITDVIVKGKKYADTKKSAKSKKNNKEEN